MTLFLSSLCILDFGVDHPVSSDVIVHRPSPAQIVGQKFVTGL